MTSGPQVQPIGKRRRSVGPLWGRPPCPWAPLPSGFDVALLDWLTTSVPEAPCWIHGRGEGGSPLYIWGEGLHFTHHQASKQSSYSLKMKFIFSCRGLRTWGVQVRVVVRGLRVFVESPVCLLPSLYVILWVCTRCLFILLSTLVHMLLLCMWSFLWVMIVFSDSYA